MPRDFTEVIVQNFHDFEMQTLPPPPFVSSASNAPDKDIKLSHACNTLFYQIFRKLTERRILKKTQELMLAEYLLYFDEILICFIVCYIVIDTLLLKKTSFQKYDLA